MKLYIETYMEGRLSDVYSWARHRINYIRKSVILEDGKKIIAKALRVGGASVTAGPEEVIAEIMRGLRT